MRLHFLSAAIVATLSMAACILDREGGLADDPASGGGTATGVGGSGTGSGVEVGGSGTGTNTGTNTGTPGGSTSGTMTGMPGPEDCQNGVDDNGDDLVDCADPTCQPAFTCVPEPPSNWGTPSYVDSGAPGDPAPACPGGAAAETLFEGPGDPATCAACTCNPAGVDCTSPVVECWYDDNDCNGGSDDTYTLNTPFNCENATACVGTCAETHWCEQTTDSQITGQCTPSGGTATIPAMWKGQHIICAAPSQSAGGCSSGEICVPAPTTDFGADLCVRRDGDHGCPSGYANATATFTGGTDDRGCSACDCDESAMSCSPGSADFHDGNFCTGTATPLNGCTEVTAPMDFGSASIDGSPGNVQGSCAATGGEAIGAVTPTGPVTLCCP